MIWAVLILALVTLQRLGELWLSNRNTRRLLEHGAAEHGAAHYPLIVAVHATWLAALWWFAPGRPIDWPLLVLPNAPLVRSGPFRYLKHPNYLIVTAEIAVLPLVFGLVGVALAFTVLNAIALWLRIRAEETALQGSSR